MLNKRVVVTSISFSQNPYLCELLRSQFNDVILNERGRRYNTAELGSLLESADAAIIGLDNIDRELLEGQDRLKVISKFGVGLDNIDLKECRNKNIDVLWRQGLNKESVAEMTLGFMLTLSRQMYQTSIGIKKGEWLKTGGGELGKKKIGIIGLGHIGKELVRILKPFSAQIFVNDIAEQEEFCREHQIKQVSKKYLYETCDIITLHTPLTAKTKNLINKEVLLSMKDEAIIINTARGKIINQDDLKEALISKTISAAGLDTYEIEPPLDQELLQLENLFCTPHIGGNSKEAVISMGESSISLLKNYFQKESL